MHSFSQRSLEKTRQRSGVALDERKAEPGAGLLGNVKCTLRGLEVLGGTETGLGGVGRVYLGGPGLRGLCRV